MMGGVGCVVVMCVVMWSGGGGGVVKASPASGNLATNEVYDTNDEPMELLPECSRGAICGLVEVNAFGINSIPLCSCPRPTSTCPLVWDQEDGKTITVGPKQYKYCQKSSALRVCGRGEKAYISSFYFQPSNFQIVSGSHRLLCYCPPTARFLAPAKSEESFQDGLMVISSVHSCNQLAVCSQATPCKEVTVAEQGSQVEIKCRCPRPLVCPTLSQQATPHDNNNYIKGSGYSVHCQLLF